MQTRMFYLDDSGAGATGYIVFSWIECEIAAWRSGLRVWLEFRKRLFADYRIPSDYELHASPFINGRGRPSLDSDWNLHKVHRAEVARLALEAISACPALRVGVAFRRFDKPRELGRARASLYRALIAHLDERLAADGELGLIFMDGDGTDPHYEATHRTLRLENRHVVEDPIFRVSGRSQWIQMADFVAYCGYQSLLQDPARRFLWHWYDQYLKGQADGPLAL